MLLLLIGAAVMLCALLARLDHRAGEEAPPDPSPLAEAPAPAPVEATPATDVETSRGTDVPVEATAGEPKLPVHLPGKALIRGRVVAVDGRVSGTLVELFVPQEGLEFRAAPEADGRFELEVRGLGPALFQARRDGEVVSPPVDLRGPLHTARALAPPGEPGVLDVYEVLIGPTVAARIQATDHQTEAPIRPFSAWLVPAAQVMGSRGILFRAREGRGGALAVGDIEPRHLGVVTDDPPLEVRVPTTFCGGTLVVVGERGLGSIRLGAGGCLREGVELSVPVAPWSEHEFEVRAGDVPAAGAELFLLRTPECKALGAFADDPPFEVAGTLRAVSDEQGLAGLLSVPAAPGLRVAAKHSDHGSALVQVKNAPGERQVIELSPPWISHGERIVFVDVEDRPIPGVTCRLDGVAHSVDESGVLTIPPGASFRSRPVLRVEHPGYVAIRRPIPRGPSEERRVVLHAAAPLTVEVIDELGAPVSGVEIGLIAPRTQPKIISGSTSEAGRFVFPETPVDGQRRLDVFPPAPVHAWGRLDPAENPALESIPLGETTVTIELARSDIPIRSLSIAAVDRVTDSPLPIDQLRFDVLSDEHDPARRWTPRGIYLGNERALVESIQDGRYFVWVKCLGGQAGVAELEVYQHQQEVTCPVDGGRTLVGHVELADSRVPVERLIVSARIVGSSGPHDGSPDRRLWSGVTKARCDAELRFELTGLMPAVYELRCTSPSGGEVIRVDLSGEIPEGVELTWAPGSCVRLEVVSALEPGFDRLRVRWCNTGGRERASWQVLVLQGRSDEPILLPLSAPGDVTVVLEAGRETGDWVELGSRAVTVAESETVRIQL